MGKTRRNQKNRRRGGSGLRLPSGVFRALKTLKENAAKKTNAPAPILKKRDPANHNNLTNANLEDLHVVNTSGPEWNLKPGNRNRSVPKNLRPYQPTLREIQAMRTLGPGVRVFTSKRRHYS